MTIRQRNARSRADKIVAAAFPKGKWRLWKTTTMDRYKQEGFNIIIIEIHTYYQSIPSHYFTSVSNIKTTLRKYLVLNLTSLIQRRPRNNMRVQHGDIKRRNMQIPIHDRDEHGAVHRRIALIRRDIGLHRAAAHRRAACRVSAGSSSRGSVVSTAAAAAAARPEDRQRGVRDVQLRDPRDKLRLPGGGLSR